MNGSGPLGMVSKPFLAALSVFLFCYTMMCQYQIYAYLNLSIYDSILHLVFKMLVSLLTIQEYVMLRIFQMFEPGMQLIPTVYRFGLRADVLSSTRLQSQYFACNV